MSGSTPDSREDLSTPDSPGLMYAVDTLDGAAITRADRYIDVSEDFLARHGSPHDSRVFSLGVAGHGLGVVWYRRVKTVCYYPASDRHVYRYERVDEEVSDVG